jgi:hypothetical protein
MLIRPSKSHCPSRPETSDLETIMVLHCIIRATGSTTEMETLEDEGAPSSTMVDSKKPASFLAQRPGPHKCSGGLVLFLHERKTTGNS